MNPFFNKELSSKAYLLYTFWVTSLAIELEYKVNFFIEIISVLGNTVGTIFTLSLFYSNGNKLGGWEWYSSLVVLGMYMILEGFTISILQPNLSRIVKHIQQGTLDFVLLKPISTQFYLSLRIYSVWGLPSTLIGLLLIFIGFIYSNTTLTASLVSIFFLISFSSILILYSIWFIIATSSIWFVKVWNANEVLRSTLVAGRYPITSYKGIVRFIFTFIIPIAFLTSYPSQALTSGISISSIVYSLILALIFFIISILFWKYALRFYTSASS